MVIVSLHLFRILHFYKNLLNRLVNLCRQQIKVIVRFARLIDRSKFAVLKNYSKFKVVDYNLNLFVTLGSNIEFY